MNTEEEKYVYILDFLTYSGEWCACAVEPTRWQLTPHIEHMQNLGVRRAFLRTRPIKRSLVYADHD